MLCLTGNPLITRGFFINDLAVTNFLLIIKTLVIYSLTLTILSMTQLFKHYRKLLQKLIELNEKTRVNSKKISLKAKEKMNLFVNFHQIT